MFAQAICRSWSIRLSHSPIWFQLAKSGLTCIPTCSSNRFCVIAPAGLVSAFRNILE